MMMKKPAAALAVAFAAALGACVSVLPEGAPPASRYTINAVAPVIDLTNEVSWSLLVEDPTATRAYNTVKIPLSRVAGRFEYYAGAEWTDRGPRLFQIALIRSFENTDRILNVGERSNFPVGDYVLQTDVRKFHIEYVDGSPVAKVEIYARLTNNAGRIYAAKLFSTEAGAARDNVDLIVAAFDAAIGASLNDIVSWTFDEAGALHEARS